MWCGCVGFIHVIGASLSELHINGTNVHEIYVYYVCTSVIHMSLNQPHTNVCNVHARQYLCVLSLQYWHRTLFTVSHLSRLRELDRANHQL